MTSCAHCGRSECYSLLFRLHYERFRQGSFYDRNVLVQPGPLTAPPEQRSKKTPSFRIIDFGRGERWDYSKLNLEQKKRKWEKAFNDEHRCAQRELRIVKGDC